MKLLISIIVNIVLCIIYMCGIEHINQYKPIALWDVSLGITFKYSVVTLFFSMFLEMLLDVYLKKKIVKIIPVICPLFYWISYYKIFPYRFLIFITFVIIIYTIYSLYLILINKLLK
jgi:hypothetical protein